MNRLIVPNTVVVEGKYDKNKLSGVINANIITTRGFGVFNDALLTKLLRRLSEKTPVIVLTDSDRAGMMIRNRINSVLPRDRIIHLYIPEIQGKEKRKTRPSKEGTLGVEGMENELLYSLFLPFSSDAPEKERKGRGITKTDLYSDGLYGRENSAVFRKKLQKALDLPSSLSAKALTEVLDLLYSYDEYEAFIKQIKENGDD